MNIKTTGLILLTSLIASPFAIQAQEKPTFTKLSDAARNGHLDKVSDNGLWAVGYSKNQSNEFGFNYPRLYDIKNKKMTWLYKSGEENSDMMACDVTNDGKIVAGQYKGSPAIWKADQNKWIYLPYSCERQYPIGKASHITPDGRYAIGTVSTSDLWSETLIMWDLTGATPKECTPANLPLPISMNEEGKLQSIQQIRATDISPDGKKFIGLVCFSYAGEAWTFMYDMDKKDWEGVGYNVTVDGSGKDTKYSFSPKYEGYAYLEGGVFSPDSKSVVGTAYSTEEADAVYSLDLESGVVKVLGDSNGMLFGGTDGNGVVYASSPSNNPIRNWSALVGKYWFDVKSLVKQVWDVDWQAQVSKDDYGLSGTFVGASADGKVLLAADYSNTPYDTYILELPESFAEVAPRVNLLDSYTVAPVNNSAFAILGEVKVMFERQIDVTGEYNSVQLLDEAGNLVANSISVSRDPGDPRYLSVAFRNRRLDVGKKYTVVIPAGVCNVAGDAPRKNAEIRVSYTGRPQAPVAVTKISPAEGTAITRINSQSNPIALTFDAEIAPVDKGGNMNLYRLDENGDRELISVLNGSISGRVLSVFPVMEQRLAKGSNYEVVIEANAVSDISGADPNAEIVIPYVGSYIPEPSIGAEIFSDNFDGGISGENWMLWDGDRQEPGEEPESWDFTAEIPWWVVRDDVTSTDMSAAAHSMFAEPDESDDWMITNQLYINDDTAVLTFKSQSYKEAGDVLRVRVYATDDIITALTDNIMDKFRYKSDLVYEQEQHPGKSVEKLEGDWTENTIKLDKYAGKNIYIAFINQNRNKSAIFVEDVAVTRDIKYSFVNLTPETVVAKDETEVSGILNVTSKTDIYKGYSFRLLNGEGKEISSVSDSDIELKAGDQVEFKFPEVLPLTVGSVNKYTIDLKVGDLTNQVNASVQDLALRTTRKVVVEKMTGQTCPNCPLGIIALDYIEQDFKDQVIPLAYHCYTGDSFNTPKAQSMNQFLGMNAAPTGRINRGPITAPMKSLPDMMTYVYKNNGLWYDAVAEELNSFAPADITISSVNFDGKNFNTAFNVKYALDMENANVNVLLVISENGLAGSQDSNVYMNESDVLGEWAKGGMYANSSNPYTFNEVVRTWEGTTPNGTGGYIPSTIKGGELYTGEISTPTISRILNPKNCSATVMLIDAETGRVLNADCRPVGYDMSGVEEIIATAASVKVAVEAGNVIVSTPEEAEVNVYALDGSIIAKAFGNGQIVCETAGRHGVAIVMVKTANGIVTRKVML